MSGRQRVQPRTRAHMTSNEDPTTNVICCRRVFADERPDGMRVPPSVSARVAGPSAADSGSCDVAPWPSITSRRMNIRQPATAASAQISEHPAPEDDELEAIDGGGIAEAVDAKPPTISPRCRKQARNGDGEDDARRACFGRPSSSTAPRRGRTRQPGRASRAPCAARRHRRKMLADTAAASTAGQRGQHHDEHGELVEEQTRRRSSGCDSSRPSVRCVYSCPKDWAPSATEPNAKPEQSRWRSACSRR